MKLTLCPKCKQQLFEIYEEEVDIGVGIQTFYVGGMCEHCGRIAVCYTCGAHDFEHDDRICQAMKESPPKDPRF